jgi:hypothetical protein
VVWQATLPGFYPFFNDRCTVKEGAQIQQDVVFCPVLNPGDARVILTWKELPRDLDVHLDLPSGDYTFADGTKNCKVWYKKVRCETTQKVLMGILDYDVTRGFGPETATIRGERLEPV